MAKEPGQDDFPDAIFDEWRNANHEFIGKHPAVTSLLYDLNRLPEVVATFRDKGMLREMFLIVEHFKMFKAAIRASALEEAAAVVERTWLTLAIANSVDAEHQISVCREEAASAIRALIPSPVTGGHND